MNEGKLQPGRSRQPSQAGAPRSNGYFHYRNTRRQVIFHQPKIKGEDKGRVTYQTYTQPSCPPRAYAMEACLSSSLKPEDSAPRYVPRSRSLPPLRRLGAEPSSSFAPRRSPTPQSHDNPRKRFPFSFLFFWRPPLPKKKEEWYGTEGSEACGLGKNLSTEYLSIDLGFSLRRAFRS